MNTSSLLRLVVPVLLTAWLAGPVSADDFPFDRSDAYRQLRQGDQARERREWIDAVHAYQTAVDMYRALRSRAPEWEREYFRFRIDYGQRELALIERQTGQSIEEWLARAGPAAPSDLARYQALYRAMLEENEALRRRVAALEDELDAYIEMEEIEQQRAEQRRRQQAEAVRREMEQTGSAPTHSRAEEPTPTVSPPQGGPRWQVWRRDPDEP